MQISQHYNLKAFHFYFVKIKCKRKKKYCEVVEKYSSFTIGNFSSENA